jgi:hypothetical protein
MPLWYVLCIKTAIKKKTARHCILLPLLPSGVYTHEQYEFSELNVWSRFIWMKLLERTPYNAMSLLEFFQVSVQRSMDWCSSVDRSLWNPSADGDPHFQDSCSTGRWSGYLEHTTYHTNDRGLQGLAGEGNFSKKSHQKCWDISSQS